MAVVVTLPWTRATLGLTFLVRTRYDPQRVSERLDKQHKTVGMWAHQMVSEGRADGFQTVPSS